MRRSDRPPLVKARYAVVWLAGALSASGTFPAEAPKGGPKEGVVKQPGLSAWVPALREVHARFKGKKGTFAQFGDSITFSMAFWAPLPDARRNAAPEVEKAFEAVNGYQ